MRDDIGRDRTDAGNPGARRTLARTARMVAVGSIAAILATIISAGPAKALISLTVDIAATVSGGASNCGGGLDGFSYDYTVTNFATAAPLVDFKVPLSNASDVCNIQAPAGWTDFFNGTELVFQAIAAGDDLAAGGTVLSGFMLDSSLPGTDEAFTADLLNIEGNIISVPVDPLAPLRVAVPEPSTLLLLSLGLLGAVGIRRRTLH